MTSTTMVPRGGAWLTGEADPAAVLTPERLSADHRLVADTADEFVEHEVLPVLARLENRDWTLARSLIQRGAQLGLLGADVPESLGGVGLDAAAALVIAESVGRCPSFSSTFGAQTGLTITPLLSFGTDEQKRRYVPRLVSGELIGAYALSESGSGSDALSARARAVRQGDGSFVLNGEKMWITNGGFADLFIVFAKVAADASEAGQFTAFIVERAFPGVSSGNEEHKMGLHGSSTTPLVLQDARVPAGNVLGEIGHGHRVAFNVLNYGRWKLAAMCSGGARHVIAEGAAYAVQRRQFGRAIASFGAVRHKLGEMVVRRYAVESMLYRTTGLVDSVLSAGTTGTALEAFEEFAIEASILKVAGSEMMDFVVDENVQIHGGNGFVSDYPAERHYRDARVNRIFEGTNEINRLLIPGMLVKRALKGTVPIIEAARRLLDELAARPLEAAPPAAGPLEAARQSVAGIKKVALAVFGTATDTYGPGLADEQEVLTCLADVLIDVYAADSAVLRAETAASPLHTAAAAVVACDAAWRVQRAARDALAAAAGARLPRLHGALQHLLEAPPLDTIALRRQLAGAVIERRVYPF